MTAVVVSPWLFGAAEPWAYLLICLLAALGVGAWLLSVIQNPRARLRAPTFTVSLLALLALVFIQILPLPYAFVKAISPASAEAQSVRLRLFEQTGTGDFNPPGLDGRPHVAVISASSAATQRSLYLLAAYVGILLVWANAFTKWAHLRRAAYAIAIAGFAMVVFALAQKFSGTNSIYWFHQPRYGGDIFGPFTNRNHFAGHINMTFGVTLGLLLATSRRRTLRALPTWRQKLAWLSTPSAGRATLLAFGAALMGAAVCASLSRGGIISLVASLGAVGAAVAFHKGLPRRARPAGAVVALLMLVAVVWLGSQPVVARLSSLAQVARQPLGAARVTATLDTFRVFSAWPVFGCGFGAFQHVFPAFQSPSIQFGRWLHAHNDYAQLLAEGGLAGALLVVLTGCLFALTIKRRFARTTDDGRLMVVGLSVGILAIALHSLFDYSLHKPANAFLLAALCGMSVAAVHLPRKRKRKHGSNRGNSSESGQAKEPLADRADA